MSGAVMLGRVKRYLRLLLEEKTAGPVLATAFLALAVPFAGFLAFMTPPGQVADETAHALRAYAVGRGELIGYRHNTVEGVVHAGVDADTALLVVGSAFDLNEAGQIDFTFNPAKKFDERKRELVRTQEWQGPSFWSLGNIALYMPAFYVPAGIALQAARLIFGASPLHALIAGRLANLFCFAAAGVVALVIARRGQALMFCALLLPMTLALAASVNPDGLMIAAAVLAAALITRALDQNASGGIELWRLPAYWLAALLIALMVALKLPYLPLAAMLLLPLPRRGTWAAHRGALLKRAAVASLVLVPALIWTAYGVIFVSAPYPRPPYAAGPLWPGPWPVQFAATDPAAQLLVLLAEPSRLWSLPWNSLIPHYQGMVAMFIGVLGGLAIVLPRAVYLIWLAALAGGAAADAVGDRRHAVSPGLLDTVLLVLGAIACVWAIYLSQYVLWTNVGEARIEGAQGRYFIPLLPMLALAVPRFGLPGGNAVRAALFLIPIAAAAADLILVPPVLIAFWFIG